MATTNANLKGKTPTQPGAEPTPARPAKPNASIIDQALRRLSSVRFGIIMLMLLLLCCILGMVIMQQNVEGFREYYAKLSPSQRNIYETLDLFNIYHSWYFTLLLAITGLNIILSSVDRFPAAWAYLRKPRRAATAKFIRAQAFNQTAELRGTTDSIAERIAATWRNQGLRPRLTTEAARTTIFAERNVWNRFGAYVVHVALLTIFVGGFLTSRYGVGGQMELVPGESGNSFSTFENQLQGEQVKHALMPFSVECTDLRQELIRPEGGLDAMNTIDWLSYIKITDNGKELAALVHLNSPVDYRGYRFFQSSFTPLGYARQVTLIFAPKTGGQLREVTIERNGAVDVEGIGHIAYTNFYPDFTDENGRAETASGDYENPAAELRVTTPDGKTQKVIAKMAQAANHNEADGHAHGQAAIKPIDAKPAAAIEELVAGSKVTLKSFEKVAVAHTLTVQYDPGRMPVYIGFVLLVVALCGVFFFAHQRVWAVVEPDGTHAKVHFGGNTNRNRPAFEGRFNSLVKSVAGGKNNE